MDDKNMDLRMRRTYKLLSQALMTMMKKKKFEKITVKDICEEAMVHRTTFYTHFEDKYALLKYCLNELEMPFRSYDSGLADATDYKDYYMYVAESVINHIKNNSEFYKVLIRKNKDESFITNFQDEFAFKLKEIIVESEKKGLKIPVPVDVVASFYSGACINVMLWWLENEMPVSVEELMKYFKLMVMPILEIKGENNQ